MITSKTYICNLNTSGKLQVSFIPVTFCFLVSLVGGHCHLIGSRGKWTVKKDALLIAFVLLELLVFWCCSWRVSQFIAVNLAVNNETSKMLFFAMATRISPFSNFGRKKSCVIAKSGTWRLKCGTLLLLK